jgi:hypothetical protein
MIPRSLGKPTVRFRWDGGLNTHPDTTSLSRNQLQTATRVRVDSVADDGFLRKEEGVETYSATGGTQGLGLHLHPSAQRLLKMTGGALTYDSVGDGSTWTSLKASLDTSARPSFVGQQGITYIANGVDPTLKYRGGTDIVDCADICAPEDTPLSYKPVAGDIVIDTLDSLGVAPNNWQYGAGGVSCSLETSIFLYGTGSLKITATGSTANCYVYKTFATAMDLSHSDFIQFWLNTNAVVEDWLRLEISEDSTNWTTFGIPMSSIHLNKWHLISIDMTGVPPTSRDAILYIRFKVNKDVEATCYIDHLAHSGCLVGEYQYAVSFYDSATGNQGPLGGFTSVYATDADEATGALAKRCVTIASNAVYCPEGTDRIRLYRTISGGTDFYLLSTITPTANAWSYTDNTPDLDLTEAMRLTSWPGQLPRGQWLIPYGDRVLHVGGRAVGSREDVVVGAAVDANTLSTGVMALAGALKRGPVVAVQIKAARRMGVGPFSQVTVNLQYAAKGGSSWTTAGTATSTAGSPWPSDGWYTVPFTYTGNAQMLFSAEYDWRVYIAKDGTDAAAYYFYKRWAASGNYIAYRLMVSTPNTVFMSNLAFPDQVPPYGVDDAPVDDSSGAYLNINSNDGQTIQGWVSHGSDLLFLKERSGYLFTGYTPDEVSYTLVLPSIGTAHGDTAKDCDGMAVWLSQDDEVYAWSIGSGDNPKIISAAIRWRLKALSTAQKVRAHSMYWNRRYYLFFPNGPAGSRCFMCDFSQGGVWTNSYDTAVWAALPFGPDGTAAIPYALTASAVLKMWSAETDQTAAVSWVARGKDDRFEDIFGNPMTVKRLRAYRIMLKGAASGQIRTEWFVNKQSAARRTYDHTIPYGEAFDGNSVIEHCPDSDILGTEISLRLSGSHSALTEVWGIELWLKRVR